MTLRPYQAKALCDILSNLRPPEAYWHQWPYWMMHGSQWISVVGDFGRSRRDSFMEESRSWPSRFSSVGDF